MKVKAGKKDRRAAASTDTGRKPGAARKAAGKRHNGARTMRLAMIGLGKMGGNMVQRLLRGGHEVVAYDRSADVVKTHVGFGAEGAKSLQDVVRRLTPPRIVWVMVPAGAPVDQTIDEL